MQGPADSETQRKRGDAGDVAGPAYWAAAERERAGRVDEGLGRGAREWERELGLREKTATQGAKPS